MINAWLTNGMVLLLLLSVACSDDPVTKEEIKPNLLFEVQYSNDAWGHQFKGFLIDGTGQVYKYDLPAAWNQADSKTGLTEQQVNENLKASVLNDLKLDPSSFKSHSSLIASLKAGSFSKRLPSGADRGSLLYYAYQFDAKNGAYLPILLAEDGDWERHRQDEEAQILVVYLKDIESRLY